jgi:hypothetical protein
MPAVMLAEDLPQHESEQADQGCFAACGQEAAR